MASGQGAAEEDVPCMQWFSRDAALLADEHYRKSLVCSQLPSYPGNPSQEPCSSAGC